MGTKPTRPEYTMVATIEQMDNGAQMVIRQRMSNIQGGVITLKKVYLDFDSLAKDLRDNMQFNFAKNGK